MSSRFLIVAPIAVVVTVALFFLMRDLIAPSSERPEIEEAPIIELGRNIKDTPLPEPTRLSPPEKEPDIQPQKLDPEKLKKDPTPLPGPAGPPGPPIGGDDPFGPIDRIDGPATPIIRPKPPYPSCGTGMGEVVLDYVVEPDGSIRDVKVVKASSSCFAKAAERATRRWRYRPKIEGGQAVRSGRKRVTLVFEEEQ